MLPTVDMIVVRLQTITDASSVQGMPHATETPPLVAALDLFLAEGHPRGCNLQLIIVNGQAGS